MAQNRLANRVNVAASGKIHHSIGAVVNGGVQLLQLFGDVRCNGAVADVGVDLAKRLDADTHRLQLRMVDVGRDNHAAAGDFVAYQLGGDLLAIGNVLHVFGDHALAGVVHLRKIAVGVGGLAAGDRLGAGAWSAISVVTVSVVSVGG